MENKNTYWFRLNLERTKNFGQKKDDVKKNNNG